MSETSPGISRRTLVKGTAWAVPAVAVATAAPAMAQSLPPVVIDWGESSACKIPGNSMKHCYDKGYVLWGVFENTSAVDASVTITGITVGGIERCLAALVDYAAPSTTCTTTLGSFTFTVAAGQTRYIAIFSNSSDDSSSTNVTVAFNYTLTGQPQQSSSQSGDVGGSPWSGDGGQGSCKRPNNCPAPPDLCGTPCSAESLDATESPAAESATAEEQVTKSETVESATQSETVEPVAEPDAVLTEAVEPAADVTE